jgi:NADPH:quinone reductase-like Zn-dependent oxidoreductase
VAHCPSPTASLTAEHLAVLAVSGVAAYRATNTLPGPLKDSRILVLQAHDGTGALAAQQLVAAGARVTVQIDSTDFIEKLRGLKLEAVKIGAPLAVLRALGEEGEDGLGVFDAVIDTVGGKELWESCKAVFGSAGQVSISILLCEYFLTILILYSSRPS